MRLADFIEENVEAIVSAAEAFASTMQPAAAHLDSEALRDHMPMILSAVARDLRSAQTAPQQLAKSLGQQLRTHGTPETAAQTHALLRAKAGFDIMQLVAEYRALRASVLRLWFAGHPVAEPEMQDDLVRFNEAIDQAVAESVAYFTAEIDRWRHVFLGVLGHDLRGPLNAILLTAEVLARMTADAPLERHTVRLVQSGKRMKTLLDDLLDFSRASLGMGLSLHLAQVDLASACIEEIELLRTALPGVEIRFRSDGETVGRFDGSRVREALGNLVGNAARYGTRKAAVDVALKRGDDGSVRLSVTNTGETIPRRTSRRCSSPCEGGVRRTRWPTPPTSALACSSSRRSPRRTAERSPWSRRPVPRCSRWCCRSDVADGRHGGPVLRVSLAMATPCASAHAQTYRSQNSRDQPMKSEPKVGDAVSWSTSQGKTTGTVTRKVTGTATVKGHTAKATKATPEFEVKSSKSSKKAIHKADALERNG